MLICDVDEFLVLHEANSISEFVGRMRPDRLGIAFNWKAFGTGGVVDWQDDLVHRTFKSAAPTRHAVNSPFKSMFRRPTDFGGFGPHTPGRYVGPWGSDGYVWVDCNGKRIRDFQINSEPNKGTGAKRVRHDRAQLNHYTLRIMESFNLKRGTPSASRGVDCYTEALFEKFDRNVVHDVSALRFRGSFDQFFKEAMSLPDVKRMHHLCCADYVIRLAEKKGVKPEEDPRRRHHQEQAERPTV